MTTEFGAPKFACWLDGVELDETNLRHVVSVEFTEAQEKLDALTIQFAVPTVGREAVTGIAKLGAEFDVEIGYTGQGSTMTGSGDIVEISHNISPSAPWTISLTGLDGLNRLKGEAQSKVWEVTHADIVNQLASDAGLTAVVDDVESSPTHTLQDNLDNAVFLRQLARDHNYFVRVFDGELIFSRLSLAFEDEAVTVNWNQDVESIQLRASINDLVTNVGVKGRNYTEDSEVPGTGVIGDLESISGGQMGAQIVLDTFGERQHLIDNAARNQTSSADERAVREMQERAEKFLTGSITILGNPAARSGSLINVDGMHYPFQGPFLITQTTHTLEPGVGYRTKIDFQSNSFPEED